MRWKRQVASWIVRRPLLSSQVEITHREELEFPSQDRDETLVPRDGSNLPALKSRRSARCIFAGFPAHRVKKRQRSVIPVA